MMAGLKKAKYKCTDEVPKRV